MDKIGVVVPSNRPEELARWGKAWLAQLFEVEAKLYVVEDHPDTWARIKDNLGRDAWIIPCRTDCIRSYGYLQAYRDGCDYILTFDDDVRPIEGVNTIWEHVQNLKRKVEPDNWVRTLREPSSPITRGLPIVREIVVSHGLWNGVPDVPATVQLAGYTFTSPISTDNQIIPVGKFYPMSGMNLAFQARLTKMMYFGLQGSDIRDPEKRWGLDRCGDIFCGVVSKTLIDCHPMWAVHSGQPWVEHIRASDPHKNLELEKIGELVPYLYGETIQGCGSYMEIANRIGSLIYPTREYCENLAEAMRVWWDLVKRG